MILTALITVSSPQIFSFFFCCNIQRIRDTLLCVVRFQFVLWHSLLIIASSTDCLHVVFGGFNQTHL